MATKNSGARNPVVKVAIRALGAWYTPSLMVRRTKKSRARKAPMMKWSPSA